MPASWKVAIVALLVGVVYGLIVWQRRRVYQSHEFLGDVKAELKKVTWPGRREVLATTSVVLVTVFFFGIFLSVIDLVVTVLRNGLYSVVGASRG